MVGRAPAEDFTAASAVLGPYRRPQLMSIHRFARLVDQIGDEGQGDRAVVLDLVDDELDRIFAGGTARSGCSERDIPPNRRGPSWEALMAFEIERAGSRLRQGAPLARRLSLRPRIAVAGCVAGGRTALVERIHRDPTEVMRRRVSRPAWEKAWVAVRSPAGNRPTGALA